MSTSRLWNLALKVALIQVVFCLARKVFAAKQYSQAGNHLEAAFSVEGSRSILDRLVNDFTVSSASLRLEAS